MTSHLQTIAECKTRIREDEMLRRKLHNTIQELKGENINKSLRQSAVFGVGIELACL